jgi:hypothetical protein
VRAVLRNPLKGEEWKNKGTEVAIAELHVGEFQAWRDDFIRESLSAKSTDLLYDSRLMLVSKADKLTKRCIRHHFRTNLRCKGAVF